MSVFLSFFRLWKLGNTPAPPEEQVADPFNLNAAYARRKAARADRQDAAKRGIATKAAKA